MGTDDTGPGASRTRPAHFDAASPASYPAAAWAPYDAIVRAAAARGVGVDLALEAPAPLWATAPGVPPGTASSFVGAWEPSAKEYGLFFQAVAERYSGRYTPPGQGSPLPRVSFWSIWNEPNYGQQLAPRRSTTPRSRSRRSSTGNCSTPPGPRLVRPVTDATRS